MRTRLGVCQRKTAFTSRELALAAARARRARLAPYRCALCRDWHLTSRTKGMWTGLTPA